MNTLAVVAAAVIVLGASGESKARHAAILARVLSYELTLDERAGDSVEIGIVYRDGDPTSRANADEWLRALQDLAPINVSNRPLRASKISYGTNDLNAALDRGVDVLLVTEGLGSEATGIAQLARARHVLTAGNSPSFVQSDLTLCVTEVADKTKILVNLNEANLERIKFSSRLLALATIIR